MGIFRRNVPIHYIPVHPDNIAKKDWIILLEAGTIVGPSAEKLRVALATLEKKIVTKYNIFLKPKHFLVLEGYDPRIHALYYCPQLYKYDGDKKMVPLEGEEIGRLVARMVSWRNSRGMRLRKCCHRGLSSMEKWTSILTVWSLTRLLLNRPTRCNLAVHEYRVRLSRTRFEGARRTFKDAG